MSDIIQQILNNVSEFHLFQVMRLLEEHGFKRFKIIPAFEMSFPSADIKRCFIDEKGYIILETTYLGLYGVDSPLPFYLVQAASQMNEEGEVLRAFLNVFNYRIYELLYRAWKRGKIGLYVENQNPRYKYYLENLSSQLINKKNIRSYAYTSFLGSRIHNAEALREILEDYLEFPIMIEQFVPTWIKLTELAISCYLGDNAILGDRVLDCSQKIHIHIGPVEFNKISELLLSKNKKSDLINLIQKYVGVMIQFDVILKIYFEDQNIKILGQGSNQLGWSLWLGEGRKLAKVMLN